MTQGDDLLLQRPIRSADDVAALSSRDRSLLARWLADSTQCDDIALSRARSRVGLAVSPAATVPPLRRLPIIFVSTQAR
jgi:hypothetical protein